jgi:prepilin-type N-terminal cleavage/methylation domain-containing protein
MDKIIIKMIIHNRSFLFGSSPQKSKGFTLIELIVVVIMVGILAAITMPAFIGQIGKARETEIKNAVGTINRSQQAYHWEKGSFAQGVDDQSSLELLNITIDSEYIDTLNIVGTSTSATTSPQNLNFAADGTKAYSGGVFFNSGLYQMALCVSLEPIDSIMAPSSGSDCGINNKIE